jgi:hypothetical protein
MRLIMVAMIINMIIANAPFTTPMASTLSTRMESVSFENESDVHNDDTSVGNSTHDYGFGAKVGWTADLIGSD